MINNSDKNATIGGIVAVFPQASSIFSEFGIDFCCGGNRLLADVIQKQGINEVEIYAKLHQAHQKRKSTYQNQSNDFNKMSSPVISAYIEDTHHSYLRRALPEISEVLSTVLRAHGKNHPELFVVYRLFGGLKADLEQHLLKEETILFPELAQPDENHNEIILHVTEIIKEHEAAGEILSELRRVTHDYSIPEDACNTYKRAYTLLIEFENDLHQHIHLENNILLKDFDERK